MNAFYDLTRLVERMHALHSTGVDRVDLRYALWLREHSEGIAWGLQQPNGFVLLPSLLADNLLNALNERWFESHQVAVPGGGAETQRYERELEESQRVRLCWRSFGGLVLERYGKSVDCYQRLYRASHLGVMPQRFLMESGLAGLM